MPRGSNVLKLIAPEVSTPNFKRFVLSTTSWRGKPDGDCEGVCDRVREFDDVNDGDWVALGVWDAVFRVGDDVSVGVCVVDAETVREALLLPVGDCVPLSVSA